MEEQEEKQKVLGTKILKFLKQKIAYMLANKQDTLVSGESIKTINGDSILGSGDVQIKKINDETLFGSGSISLQKPLVSGTNIKTINNQTILGSGNLEIGGAKLYDDYGTNTDGSVTQKFTNEKLRGQKVEIGQTATAGTNGGVAVGPLCEAAGDSSVAVGRDANSKEMYGVAVGPKAIAETAGAVAIGYDITSGTGTGSIAIGYNTRGSTLPSDSTTTGSTDSTIAIGFSANAADQAGIAIGSTAEARYQCLAIGNNATKARGRRNIAIGPQAESTAESGEDTDGAIAMGVLAKVTGDHGISIGYSADATERNTVALSLNAQASKEGAIAIGANSDAQNTNAVALGYGSTTSVDNTISVGTSTNNRRIMNVAAGVADTDAVNKKQLDTAIAGAGGGGSSNITYYNVHSDAGGTLSTSGFDIGEVCSVSVPAGTYFMSAYLRTASASSSYNNIWIGILKNGSSYMQSTIGASASIPSDFIYQGIITLTATTTMAIGVRANYASLPWGQYDMTFIKLS